MTIFTAIFRISHNEQSQFDPQRQRILRHKQQLHEQEIKRELENHENDEQLKYEQQRYEQRYGAVNEQQQSSIDDEPDEKWKFYQYSRRL